MLDFTSFMIKANKCIRASREYNFRGCRIEIPSKFNFKYLEKELVNYEDKLVIDLLRFGFPLGNDKDKGRREIPKNHKGATEFPEEMTRILNKEIETRAAIGPFVHNPFTDARFSPLKSVEKKDSLERRLILDLSLPEGNAVNEGIDKDSYVGTYSKLELPSVDRLVEKIVSLGLGCKVFKIDLSRGYRQIPLDPGSVHYLGYVFKNKFYFDCSLSMGSVSSARGCQIVTSAVVYIFTNHGFFAINYLDDLGGTEDDGKAEDAYSELHQILKDFGLTAALDECSPPCTCMTFLGIEVNTIKMILKIPDKKWAKVLMILHEWETKQVASLKEVQKLAGLLNFVCRCVRSGRIYLSRILNFLRIFENKQSKPVTVEVKEDIEWWKKFGSKHNGITLMVDNKWTQADEWISSDSCLTGGGGLSMKENTYHGITR